MRKVVPDALALPIILIKPSFYQGVATPCGGYGCPEVYHALLATNYQ